MMLQKHLQKILAVALMTSFLSTSFVVGVSEAASTGRHSGHGTAHHQQIRRSVHKAQPVHRPVHNHKAQTMHRPGFAHHGPAIHNRTHHRAYPMVHRGGPVYHRPVIIHRYHPVPPPPPPGYYHHSHRSMHTKDWVRAAVVGGVIGAVIANNTRPAR